MLVTFNNPNGNSDRLIIEFEYGKNDKQERTTTCRILEPITRDGKIVPDTLWGTGVATLCAEDQFEKSVGRKISLQRAMIQARLARPVRAELWVAVWKIMRRPK